MKKNIFKSVASLALSLALVFSATAIFSKYTASAADATNSKTFDFEESTIGLKYYNSSSAFETTDEAWRGTAAPGKSLKVYKDKIDDAGPMRALLTTEGKSTGEKFNVEWGRTYKVTLYYKTVGIAPEGMEAWKLGLYTCYPSPSTSATVGPEQSLHAPIWFRKTATSGWSKAETTFTAAYSAKADADKTSLGLIVKFPKFSDNNAENAYAVYIDDVTVEEITPETPNDTTKTFDFNGFDSYSDGYANSGLKYTAPEDLHIADSGKSLMVYKDKIDVLGYHRALLTTDGKSTGEKYSVEWGKTYKVTLWYKTVGNFGGKTPWSLGLFTGLKTGFINTTAQQTMSEQLEFPTEATDWTKFETTFTATESKADRRDNTYLGIGVNFPVFNGNENYNVYIDDVTVSEIRDNGDVNGDGKVDTDDFNTLRQELLNNNTASANKCDVNGDGSVDIRDLVALDEKINPKNN